MRPSSSSKSTLLSAVNPPNFLVPPRASKRTAISGLAQLARAAPRGQDALRAEDHHEHENEAENHALVLGGLELGRKVGQIVAEDLHAGITELVDPQRKSFENLEVEHRDDRGAQDGAGDRAHAPQDDHGEDADRLHEGQGFGIDEDLLGGEERADRARERGAAGESEEASGLSARAWKP